MQASAGMPLFPHDKIQTDSTGRTTIDFASGGFIELFENTDPFFELILDSGQQFVNVVMQYGRAFIDGTLYVTGPWNEQYALGSAMFLEIRPPQARAIVVRGQVRVRLRQTQLLLREFDAATIIGGRIPPKPDRVTKAEIAGVEAWRSPLPKPPIRPPAPPIKQPTPPRIP